MCYFLCLPYPSLLLSLIPSLFLPSLSLPLPLPHSTVYSLFFPFLSPPLPPPPFFLPSLSLFSPLFALPISSPHPQSLIICLLVFNMVSRFLPVDHYSLYVSAIIIQVTELGMPLWFCCSLWNFKQ